MFIDRELELGFLESRWGSDRAELVIIYGPRGIGKTELIKHFVRDKRALYFFVTGEDLHTLLSDFMKSLPPPFNTVSVSSLKDFFRLLGELSRDERLVVVFDEFQRLGEVYKGALSILQGVWDEFLSKTKIFLILVGSAVSVFERIGKSYESPLYGRSTGVIELFELDYWASRFFFLPYSEEDKLFSYSILGGIPSYLKAFDPSRSVEENIVNNILMRGSRLYDEPIIFLLQETREPAAYMSILKAIASGYTKFSEISDVSGVERNKLSKYLNVLIDRLKIVEREKPIMEKGRGIYRIKNNFFNFWFRYVLPNKSLLELGKTKQVLEQILVERTQYVSKTFELVVKHFLERMNGQRLKGELIKFNQIGRWWKGDIEIDLIAVDEKRKHVYFIECKYTKEPVTIKTLSKLISKAEEFRWRKGDRKETYIIFAHKGFTFEQEEDTLLITLEEMVKIAEKEFKIKIYNEVKNIR